MMTNDYNNTCRHHFWRLYQEDENDCPWDPTFTIKAKCYDCKMLLSEEEIIDAINYYLKHK